MARLETEGSGPSLNRISSFGPQGSGPSMSGGSRTAAQVCICSHIKLFDV